MRKYLHFLLLLFFFWGLFFETGWGQFLNTLYTHREIDFFTEEENLEGYDENAFQLIPNTEIYINFNTGIGFLGEKSHLTQIENLIEAVKVAENQDRPSTNQLGLFRENTVKPYQLGINMDIFLYKYFGVGFTYSRSHYFSHTASISPPTSTTNYYNETIGYTINAIGNSFQFSVMGRYPFGPRPDYNIFLVGGLGYTFSTLAMTLRYDDKINSQNRNQKYTANSHAFHLFSELIFKVKHFNFGFGLLIHTIHFSDYKLPDNPESGFTPQEYQGIKLGPTLYFKIGFNL